LPYFHIIFLNLLGYMIRHKSYWFFTFSGLILIVFSFLFHSYRSKDLNELAALASTRMEKKLQVCEDALYRLIDHAGSIDREEYYRLFQEEQIGIYLLKSNGAGLFWNNSQIPLSDTLQSGTRKDGMLEIKRGYYLFKKIRKDSLTAFSLCLIKPDYDVRNNHLKNEFTNWIGLPAEIEFSKDKTKGVHVELRGEKLFSITSSEEDYSYSDYGGTCAFLLLTGILFLYLAFLIDLQQNPSLKKGTILFLSALLIRIIFLAGWAPSFLRSSFLYDVRIFGDGHSFFNPTLADLLFNSCFLLYTALLLFFSLKNLREGMQSKIKLVILLLLCFLTAWQFNHSIKSLVANSTLSFDLLSISSIDAPTLCGLGALALNAITVFLLLYQASALLKGTGWRSYTSLALCMLPVSAGLYFTDKEQTLIETIWPLLFSLFLISLVKLRFQRFSLGLGFLIAFLSITGAGIFNHYITINQRSELSYLADKLSERQDAYLENEFSALPEKIRSDKNLEALINILPETKKEIDQFLKLRYFKGYFKTYNIDFSLFNNECKPLLDPSQAILMNEGFFEDQIKFYSDSTISKELFFVSGHLKNTRYIGKIEIAGLHLYILMEKKQFEEMGTFPDLLLDASQQKNEKLKSLPHVVYRAGQRINKYGEINYPFNLADSITLSKSEVSFNHHFFTPDETSTIIISEKIKNWEYYFTYNSYLFLFFSSISFFSYFIYTLFFTSKFRSSSLTRRIQTIIILLLLLAMSAVGITSGKLVTDQFEAENVKTLEEKTQAIFNEFTTQFKPDELFNAAQRELINLKLQEYSGLYHSDISFFDSEGGLFNTSQLKLYELGLAAPVANPRAYFAIKENKTSSMCVTEKAGTLNYLSLYTPVFNDNNKLIGFINLPYFARQSNLTSELSNIISALINVYVILFVISILAGLVLAGYITKPLRLIQQQISGITLGKQNETLVWESNDEVGKLVQEYNNMLLKLEQSAGLLAQSERESAWREMAKQVAHEIKNPLTPMKLNLQYLQHVMNSNPDDFKEKFQKASNSIIEQIDTLAAIATEFSNFAKLPGTKLEKINLMEVIQSSVNLFERKDAHIQIEIPLSEMWVKGDKEQALRVFNNLIKNARQACKETQDAHIRISAEINENSYVIRVSDNGCGIPNEMKEKIFTPNFTTKSSGSGLGLAMVSNIMNSFGGKIWFESEKDKGSTFYVEFLKTE